MELGVKEALDNNWTLLVKNIIPGDELMEQLRQHSVFPESAIKDIQSCSNTEEKNSKMLDSLRLRGTKPMGSFCDALQMSGHNFLADFLREEASSSPSPVVEASEIVKKFPVLQNAMIKREREEFASFLENKVKEGVLQQMWQKNYKEKEKVMDAKEKQIQQSMQFAKVIQEKDSLIQQLEEGLQLAAKDAADKGVQLSQFNRHVDQMKNHHKEDLEKQMNYNTANDRSLRRLTERQFETEKALEKMNLQMQPYVPEMTQSPSPTWPIRTASADPMDDENSALGKTQATLKVLLQRVESLHDINEKHETLLGERQVVLSMVDADVNSDLKNSVRSYMAQNTGTINVQRRDIADLERELELLKQSTVDKDTADEQKEEIEKLKNEVNSKQEKIYKLTEENDRLKRSIAAIRQRDYNRKQQEPISSKPRPLTPRFRNYGEEKQSYDTKSPERQTIVLSPVRKPAGNTGVKYDASTSFPPLGPPRGTGSRIQHPAGYQNAMRVSKISANPTLLTPRPDLGRSKPSTNILQISSVAGQKPVAQSGGLGNFQATYGRQQTVELARKGGLYQ